METYVVRLYKRSFDGKGAVVVQTERAELNGDDEAIAWAKNVQIPKTDDSDFFVLRDSGGREVWRQDWRDA